MRVIELFAGAGGAALGLEQAGVEHAGLYELDPAACATMRAAGLGPVVEGDIREQDFTPHRGVDLLWSSFPCQCWSTAGKRLGARDTERNGWPWTVRAIDEAEPKWVICENVYGLLCHTGGEKKCDRSDPMGCPRCYFDQVIMVQLRARFAWVDWWLLDAAGFGVPQHRRRVFIVAGPRPVAPPQATHGPGMFTKPYTPASAALPALQGHLLWGAGLTGRGGALRSSRPAPTVKGRGNLCISGADHVFVRNLSPAECAKLQDFPDDYPWQGNKTQIYRQIGNAVPPTLARVVVQAIIRGGA